MSSNIEAAREGNRLAQAALVESLRPRLVKMASYYARACGEDADDLLQEAWVGLLEALPEIDLTIGSPEQYLIQRARWRMLDAVRRARARRCLPLEDDAVENLPGPSLESAVSSACVSEFARRLKDNQRAILSHLLAGFTWRETGDSLGCTSANIAYHVRQIRREYEKWSGQAVQA
ncbi:MAG: sigma-70 family RNA polymerase sigma factor [Armatimonadetes bacterium]|nr:sigma-70 family RNA polymerase sigma factor [Armatimonadota bacterium]